MAELIYNDFSSSSVPLMMLASVPNTLTVTSNKDDGSAGTLRQILSVAQDGDIITFNLEAGQNTIVLEQELVISARNLTIDGLNGGNQVVIDGNSSSSIFNLDTFIESFTVENAMFQNGKVSGNLEDHVDGGVIFYGGGDDDNIIININSVNMLHNQGVLGGSIAVYGNTVELNVKQSNIYTSVSDFDGGAIYIRANNVTANFYDATAFIPSSAIANNVDDAFNTGDGNGGAVNIVASGTFVMTGGLLSNNKANGKGGAMWNYGTTTLDKLEFSGNKATLSGGAIYNEPDEADNPLLTITNTSFTNNSTQIDGGAIYNNDARLSLQNVKFRTSRAEGSGGAVYNGALGTVSFSGVTCSGNFAKVEGSALFNAGKAEITDSVFGTDIDTVANRGTMTLKGKNSFSADVKNYGTIDFTDGSETSLKLVAKMINDAQAEAQDIGSGAFILDRNSVKQNSGEEVFDVIFEGAWTGAENADFTAKLSAAKSTQIFVGKSFTDAFGRVLWFGQNNDYAGLTDRVKLNSTYETVDFQKFTARNSIDETYDNYNGVIEITGGFYDYDLFAGNARFVITGDVSLERESATKRGRFIFGGAYGDIGSNNTLTVESGAALSVDRVVGGSVIAADGSYGSAESAVTFETGSSASIYSVYGGYHVQNAAVVTLTGDVTLNLDGGVSATDYAICGDLATSKAQITRIGDTHLNISDGTYDWIVAGGGMVGQADATYTQVGNTYLEITGGTFVRESIVFGGCAANHGWYGNHTRIEGNTNILVDVTGSNVVSVACIYAGSNGAGVITGGTSVTFTGNGDNLTFNDEWGGISGDCANYDAFVQGKRSLNFSDFTGKFDAQNIEKLDIMTFNSSVVKITSEYWFADEISQWQFSIDSAVDWKEAYYNDFTGDTLIFGKSGDVLTDKWTVIDSSSDDLFNNLDQASQVSLLGESAAWDGASNWVSASYKLYVDSEKHDMVVALK